MLKFLHTSDWHLGKRLGEFRLMEEQQALTDWILQTAIREEVDGLLLSGDIYDRSVPPAEAVTLLDGFLTRLAQAQIPLFAISGNHDSAERLSFGSSLMDARGIHFSPLFDGRIRSIPVEKNGERAYVHLIPFLRPVHVSAAYGLDEGLSYSEAMAEVLDRLALPADGVHLALCHQFFTGCEHSESEEIPLVGTLDAVEASLLDRFDYAALGHLHRAQRTGRSGQYAGTLMPYAFSETDAKGCFLLTIENGAVSTRFLPVPPGLTRTLATLTGTYDALMDKSFRDGCPQAEDYLYLILDEATPVPDAMARLSTVYPRIVRLTYKHLLGRLPAAEADPVGAAAEKLSPETVFASFFTRQNDEPLSAEDAAYIRRLLTDWEEGAMPCDL